ncbi:DUF2231 domain-containing protein [Nocardioides donggukensis]|uniref:DUF2231 domain-containing protein n=1 Tax=Nocardioides donggukensis TaxID=2774019 RepID=A0A927PZG8_9ACTN|nr:DUF2231 domain-containing protein [Nocardioides donggukensis]MBD8870148.1 hypothetical protein [Nocardioides donggukensis]
MDINGLPLHPLVVHAAVVLIPIAAVLAGLYAAVPRWRWATRWPMAGAALAALGSVLVAYFSGRDFVKERFPDERSTVIQLHEERAEVLLWLTIIFVAVVLLAAWGLGGPSALASGRGARGKHAPLIEWSLVAMLAIFAVSLILMTIQTGEAGARSIWG